MKIKKVEIEGFRAYKFRKDGIFDFTLDDGTPSNFVALYAPNGFGKSSFYDAVEWAFTSSLDRYTAEYNKKNNHSAARGTKQDQVPLKILRNKDVPENIVTRVEVITTRGDFPRSLPKLRSNSIDLDLKPAKNKHKKVTNGFEKIILSQDAIDRFLREAKPQERYQLFMKHFGGEAEALREEITAILNENKMALDSLRKQKLAIKKLLKSPVDSTIFDKVNALVESLNSEGESISLVTEAFDSSAEYKLLSSIIERKHALSSSYAEVRKKENSLLEHASRLEDLRLNLAIISDQSPRFTLLTKGAIEAQRYQALSAAYDKNLKDWQQYSEQLTALDAIENLIPSFLIEESESKKASSEREILINKQAGINLSLNAAQNSVKQCQDSLTATDQRALALRSMLAASPAVYSALEIHQSGLQELKSKFQKKLDSLIIDKAEQARVTVNLERLSSLPVNVETLKGPDSILFDLPTGRLQEFYSAQHELALLQQHDSTIRVTQAALTRQKHAIELLVSQGLAYLADWPSDTCPLCRLNHPSSEALTSAIRNNDLLTEAERQNAIQLEQIATRLNVLKSIVDSTLTEAKNRLSKKIIDLQTKISELSSRIKSEEQESQSLVTKITTTQQAIEALQLRVWSLDSNELHSRVDAELATLFGASASQQEQLSQANKHLADVQAQMEKISARLEALQLYVESIPTKESHKAVVAFAMKEAVRDFGHLLDYCTQKRANLKSSIQESSTQAEKLSAQCHQLQNTMLHDGNWIDFQLLCSQKDDASKIIGDAKIIVDSYSGSLRRLLGEDVDLNPILIKSKIEQAIQDSAKQSDYLSKKIDKIELLIAQVEAFKPYLESFELRKNLADIDKKIIDHQLVNTKLSADRELIFAELRERIGSFFFSDLINAIYSKIDPHPSFKEVEFIPDFDSAQPGLNIVLKDDSGGVISPMLYFSAAQLNILSLSVFLANALHAKDDKGNTLDVILIDDPIQSMDSINVLAVIDLLRNISLRFDKQIIISTHDENFFDLLKLKIPTEVFGSKFLQLESFGVVSQEQSASEFVARLPRSTITNDGTHNK